MDGWNKILSYWVSAYFQGLCHVSFREGIQGNFQFPGTATHIPGTATHTTPIQDSQSRITKKVWEWYGKLAGKGFPPLAGSVSINKQQPPQELLEQKNKFGLDV